MTDSDILLGVLEDLKTKQQAMLDGMHVDIPNSGITPDMVNLSVNLSAIDYAMAMIQSRDLGCHLLNFVER